KIRFTIFVSSNDGTFEEFKEFCVFPFVCFIIDMFHKLLFYVRQRFLDPKYNTLLVIVKVLTQKNAIFLQSSIIYNGHHTFHEVHSKWVLFLLLQKILAIL